MMTAMPDLCKVRRSRLCGPMAGEPGAEGVADADARPARLWHVPNGSAPLAKGSSMAFYVSWTSPELGKALRRFGNENSAMELACGMIDRRVASVEVGSIVEGRLLQRLSGDELRRACKNRRSMSPDGI